MIRAQRILVTGAGGFVGTYLCKALAAQDPAPEIISAGLSCDRGIKVVLDLTDAAATAAVVSHVRPDTIVHLAGQASVGAAQANASARTFAVNLGGTLNLALAVAQHASDATVLFTSSSEVYGHAFCNVPLDEETVPEPANAYALSKLMAEGALAAVLPSTARLIVVRPFNHTGAGQLETFALPSFAGQIARIEAGAQPPVLSVGNLDAHRDVLDVRDVVAAYVGLLAASARFPARSIYNVATGAAQPLRAFLEALRKKARVPFEIRVAPDRLRASDIPYAAGSSARLLETTGWRPVIGLDETLAALLDDARARQRSNQPS